MIKDLDLTGNFEELYKKPVFLYGAGNNGRIALQVLKEFGIMPEAFCDSNPTLKGNVVDGILIESLDDLIKTAQTKQIIIIITTSSNYYEPIVSMLSDNQINCEQIYTFTGFLYAAYFNEDTYAKSSRVSCLKNVWLHNQKLIAEHRQAVTEIYKLLLKSQDTVPVIVYQPGKVGSNSVEYSLKQCGVEVIRSHGILYPAINSGVPGMAQSLIECIKSVKKLKMITLVREPISKDIGHFFQKMDFEMSDVGWLVKGLAEENFQRSFLNYLSVITPLDFTEGNRKNDFSEKMICHIDMIGKMNKNGAYWGWFDEELKKNLGIDILSKDFDIERGYSIIQHDNIELLVMKLERLNDLEDIIGQFIGIKDFRIISTNKAEGKAYKYAYKQFLEEVILPQKYVDFYYKDNIYTNHFYGEEERKTCYEKWSRHVR